MAHALECYFDDEADAAIRALWQRLEQAGVPSLASRTHRNHRPHVTFAVAGAIPPAARKILAADLALLSMPRLWLYTLGTFPTSPNALLLCAVTDAELLAVHVAVHDALAGRVRDPSAYYLPGAWVPHCLLAEDVTPAQLTAGFAALHPIEPIRVRVTEVGVTATRTGDTDLLSTV
ncbi:MAG TPA: 2'-5' RNA ligase family protein [Pseudonocardiaceae bacterium]|jgi:2'-5' RNA ligase|nr:2'-5' RNA ligase family protein [Pseudonocardiaceae bacterium]